MPTTNDISVVIPTLHRPMMLKRAVQSALNQTLPPAEILVVIDGPDDITARAIESISDSRVRIIQRQHNGGVASARNTGVANAKYQWIAFLDDDDQWLPSKLE